jgi:putative iron-regulated protein
MDMKTLNIYLGWAALMVVVLLVGCKGKKDRYAEEKEQLIAQYADLVHATYEDTYNKAVELRQAIDALVASPGTTTLEAAKSKWLSAREPYGQTEAFRFGDGPIDDVDGPEGQMNAWPLDENYIDYVRGGANAGIVNDSTVPITTAALQARNEVGGERNIALGFHAIEFLLWGQDDADVNLLTPGQRPYTDFVVGGGGTATNQARRVQYLQVVTQLLVDDLAQLEAEWRSGSTTNYRATFLSLENDEALRRIFTGIGVLCKSELAGERMFTALDNQDQEDEHSCFSDNTHRDIINNFQGIANVYRGSYLRVDGSTQVTGYALSDLAAEYDATLNKDILARIDDVSAKTRAIPAPFDHALTQETVGGSGPIQAAVNALQALGDRFAEIASKMGITISTALPD